MATWASKFVPLIKGLDLSKESTLGSDELHLAYNVDYGPDGSIKGRPSRAAADLFYVRDPDYYAGYDPRYLTASTFANTARVPTGLMRLRDGSGERPVLATEGRLFAHEGSKWHDRGHFACARVDRLAALPTPSSITAPDTQRPLLAPDFGYVSATSSYPRIWSLFNDSGALEQTATTIADASTTMYPGTATRSGTTTAGLYVTPSNLLIMVYRTAGAATLSRVQLAADARVPSDIGDAPCICASASNGGFLVIYRTTTVDVFKVLLVTSTGSVTWTYTKATAEAGLQGIWVDYAGIPSGACALVAFTHGGGLTIRRLAVATGAITGSDATDNTTGGASSGFECVVGGYAHDKAYWAYKASGRDHLLIGWVDTTTDTANYLNVFRGVDSLGNNEPSLRWSICHQPIVMGLGARAYLTVSCAAGRAFTATWLTLDLSNWFTDASAPDSAGPFAFPTIVARGESNATYPHKQPCGAVALADGAASPGFTFPTQDWQRFAGEATTLTLTGTQATCGNNRVTISKPREAQLGETTVFSGSVPHMVARGDCVELGFPFLAGQPGLYADAPVAGGSLTDGASYTVQCCWTWVDEAGQMHRSAPSVARTVVMAAPNLTIRAYMVPPWLTEKVTRISMELYCTPASPTSAALKYLVSTTAWTGSSSEPYVTADITSTPSGTTEPIYTDGAAGSELANYHVPGDGGVTAVGRRLWMADATHVYASKLWTSGYGPQFNDDAFADQPSLYVNLPAGAGRVIALENLDDKVIVFCARGVFLIQDGGPNNLGVGADFAPPLRVSDLAIAGPRSSCATDLGVLFCSTLDTVDASRGGPWLIDRQFTFTERQFLGRQALAYHLRSSSWVPEVAYSPERQQAYVTTNKADEGTSHGVVVLDMRLGKWATWDTFSTSLGSLQSITCINGTLWAHNNEPAPYSAAPGTDDTKGDYAMAIRTADFAANGLTSFGWARVRSVSAIEALGTGTHTLTMTAVQDGQRTLTSGAISLTAPSASTTWPTSRQAPEWRLPSQKCSTIRIGLSATPATARWSAIELQVAPLPLRAPAGNRS